jgi:hypothetical protein
MSVRCLLVLSLSAACAACAGGPPPRVVSVNDLGRFGPLAPGQALVIAFAAGDTIPLDVAIDGPLVRSPPAMPPVALEVRRSFYLRLDKDGMQTSLDGVHFGDNVAPGTFMMGVGATKEGVRAQLRVRTPTPREPEGKRNPL